MKFIDLRSWYSGRVELATARKRGGAAVGAEELRWCCCVAMAVVFVWKTGIWGRKKIRMSRLGKREEKKKDRAFAFVLFG